MKSVIIICSDKCRKYGDYLTQLISTIDDDDEKILASVWSIKEYNNNSSKLSSDQYLLFIGNDQAIRDKKSNMKVYYEQYKMKYAWLGHQAALFVDGALYGKEYSDFKKYISDIFKDGIPEKIKEIDINMFKNLSVAMVLLPLTGTYRRNKMVEEQQYICLVYDFFINGLRNFMND